MLLILIKPASDKIEEFVTFNDVLLLLQLTELLYHLPYIFTLFARECITLSCTRCLEILVKSLHVII